MVEVLSTSGTLTKLGLPIPAKVDPEVVVVVVVVVVPPHNPGTRVVVVVVIGVTVSTAGLATTRTLPEPTGKVMFPLHAVLPPAAINCVNVTPLSVEYQTEVLAARVPDKVTTPAAVGVVIVTLVSGGMT